MTKKQITTICKQYYIKNYTINDDMSIDVEDDVEFDFYYLSTLPLTFRKVSGDFLCTYNKLTLLKGCPYFVGGDFNCSFNNLISLQYSPKIVIGNFNCGHNIFKTRQCLNLIDVYGNIESFVLWKF